MLPPLPAEPAPLPALPSRPALWLHAPMPRPKIRPIGSKTLAQALLRIVGLYLNRVAVLASQSSSTQKQLALPMASGNANLGRSAPAETAPHRADEPMSR
jgi:hypothetical protein